jgi:enoyl-CoA hydratase/carnithine racemase
MSDHDFKTLRLAIDGGVATVTIDNPPLNLLDAGLLTDLDRLAAMLERDEAIRVLILQSADPDFFIPHGDMTFVDDPESFVALPVALEEDAALNPMQRVIERVRKLPQLTIGKLAGIARGGGAELFSALDMRFAGATRGKLAQMEVRTGIIPGSGATVYLPRLVGRARALEIILGSELIDAPLAERYGWINRAVPDAELDAFVDTLARRIAGWAPGIIAAAKQAVDANDGSILDGLKVQNEQLGVTFEQPAAAALTRAALKAGAQTRDGEKNFEQLTIDAPY